MTGEVHCSYSASGRSQDSQANGTITLTGCNPSISNDETLGSWDVIGIVLLLVLLGLAGQWLMGHIDRRALHSLKEDLGHVVKVHHDDR